MVKGGPEIAWQKHCTLGFIKIIKTSHQSKENTFEMTKILLKERLYWRSQKKYSEENMSQKPQTTRRKA